MRALRWVSIVVLALAGSAIADAPPKLWEHGAPVKLTDGLNVRADESVWISRRDLSDGLGIVVRALIPPVGDAEQTPRKKRRPARRTFMLSQHDFTVRFDERQIDATTAGNEVFPLKGVAKGLGWSIEARDGGYNLVPTEKAAKRGTKLGDRFPDLVLEGLDGKPRSTDAMRGTRVLIVAWASWSPKRRELATWATEWKLRADKGLDLLVVAVDIEGVERVRRYLPPGIEPKVAIDRNGDVPALVGSKNLAQFVLLDELGVVRARGERGPTPSTIQWIDRHLDEPLVRVARTTVRALGDEPETEELRARLERKPNDTRSREALARALEDADDLAGAILEMETVWRSRKQSPSLAMRLARMHLDNGERHRAMIVLDETRRKHRGATWLRTQRWALIHPERFYAGDVDVAWLAETLRQENLELGKRPKR